MSERGLVPTRQVPANAAAQVDADEQTPSAVWEAVATADGFRTALVDGVRELLAGTHHSEHQQVLEEAGVTAAHGMYAAVLAALDRPREDVSPSEYAARDGTSMPGYHALDRHAEALRVTAGFGTPEPTIVGHLSLEDLADGPLAVLDAVDRVPTVAVRVGEAFRERDREQRERTLRLLATLGQACAVRVVCTGYTARWLVHQHRDILPAEFSERVTARGDTTPIDDLVAAARDALDPEGRPVSLLRDLADEPGETAVYGDVSAACDVTPGRVSQLFGDLEDLQLAERFGKRDAKRARLLPAGSALLDTLDAERGRQAELDSQFSETGQPTPQSREPRRQAREGGGEDPPDRDRSGSPYTTDYIGWPHHHATASVATAGGITAVEETIDRTADRTRWVSYDDERDEAVVAVRATTPFQYVTSIALALASPGFFDRVLPVSRLETIDDDPAALRDARCIGHINEETRDDPKALRDALVKWGKKIGGMTTDMNAGEYDDRDRFRGEIMQSAHGLAGSIVHLLDLAGVDLVRELRVPHYHSHGDLTEIAKTVSIATAIQSHYSGHSFYRQVFEARPEKRRIALPLDVDAADPYGEYIGSLVIRGPQAHRLAHHVEGMLPGVLPVHEDSGEIAVRVPIGTPDRTAHAEVLARILASKSLESTREAVALFRALVPSVYDTAEALYRLGSEGYLSRGLRLDEIRYAIGTLDASQILPDMPRTVSRVVAALLRSASPLTQTAIADLADVSTRSLRRHLETLMTFDLVRRVDGGYRFALPFNDPEADERGAWILPAPVDEASAAAQDLLYELVEVFIEDPRRFGDPDDPVCGVFLNYPYNWGRLRAALPAVDPWIRVAKALCDDPDPEPTAVEFGATIEQTPLQEPPERGVAG